jgi:hypothetical protein
MFDEHVVYLHMFLGKEGLGEQVFKLCSMLSLVAAVTMGV